MLADEMDNLMTIDAVELSEGEDSVAVERALERENEAGRCLDGVQAAHPQRGLDPMALANGEFLGFVLICGKTRGRSRRSCEDEGTGRSRRLGDGLRRSSPDTSIIRLSRRTDEQSRIVAFRYHVVIHWYRQLCRRSQRMADLANEFLPKPPVLHSWMSARFAVRHPR